MGMLMNFYTGDKEQIVAYLTHDGTEQSTADNYFMADADFSFHLSFEELEEMIISVCSLLGHPPVTFSGSIKADLFLDLPNNPERGIHEMSNTFIDLFASLSRGQAAKLYELCYMIRPEQTEALPLARFQRLVRKFKRDIGHSIAAIVIAPLIAANWLFSSIFRKDRKQSKAKQAQSAKKVLANEKYTLLNAIEALIDTCRAAKTHQTRVIYAWSL